MTLQTLWVHANIYNHNRVPKSASSNEIVKSEWVSMERKSLFYGPGLYMPRIKHMLFVDLNDNFSCKENKNFSQRSLIMLGFMWGSSPHSSSLLSTRMTGVTTRTRSSGTDGQNSALLHFTFCWKLSVVPMGRLSVLSTPVIHVVFLIVYSLQPLTEQLHNKRSNSWLEQ